jgi:hypothetical protein
MKKEKMKVNPNIKALKASSKIDEKSTWLEDYRDLNTFKIKPINKHFIERLAEELIKWSRREESWCYQEFYTSRGIHRAQYYKWLDNHIELREAHDLAKEIIGIRRETRLADDPSSVKSMMPMYSPDWKEMEEWRSKMKIEQVASAQPTQIVLGSLQGVKES